MKRITAFAISLLVASTQLAFADDFSGKQFGFGTTVSVGTLLECDMPSPLTLERLSPPTYKWALSTGLLKKSAVTESLGYSRKVTTKNSSGERALVAGCWIAQKIVTETVNGNEKVYAQASYKISDAVKQSPLVHLAVCKKKKQSSVFSQGDYEIQYENSPTPCKTDPWNERLPSLFALEKESALFELQKAIGGKGYIRGVSW